MECQSVEAIRMFSEGQSCLSFHCSSFLVSRDILAENPTSDSWDYNALKFSGFSVINTQACMLSHFSRVQLFATPPGFLCPWNSPGKNTWVDCHALLQGIFLTQGSNLFVLQFLHCRWIRHCRVSGEPINIQCWSVKSPRLWTSNARGSRFDPWSGNSEPTSHSGWPKIYFKNKQKTVILPLLKFKKHPGKTCRLLWFCLSDGLNLWLNKNTPSTPQVQTGFGPVHPCPLQWWEGWVKMGWVSFVLFSW